MRGEQQTTAICSHCGAWHSYAVSTVAFMSLRYELPCQRCGQLFHVGDKVSASDLRYFWWWTSVHRAGTHSLNEGFRLDAWLA